MTVERLEYRSMEGAKKPAFFAVGGQDCEAMYGGKPSEVAALESRLENLDAQAALREQERGRELEQARQESFERGRREADQQRNQALGRIGTEIAHSMQQFAEERDRYFTAVEQEVVRLALGIAARILHREAQMDPLLLSGAVRVALGQLAENTEVVLRVPAAESELWREMLELCPNLPLHPKVRAESDLPGGACLIETHLGVVDLGIRAQLDEIERGFFDLLERRPHTMADPPSSAARDRRRMVADVAE